MLNGFRVKLLRLSHVHKIFNETGPSYLSEHFVKTSDVHQHFTRSSIGNFVIPSVSGAGARTSYYSGIKDWNSLPLDIKQSVVSMDSNMLQNNILELDCNLWNQINSFIIN